MSGAAVGRFFVAGRPRTKGSLTPQVSRSGRGAMRVHLVESGEYAVPWKLTMIKAIRKVHPDPVDFDPYEGPVEVRALFLVNRTIGVDGLVWPSHRTVRPTADDIGDEDKFERNLLDALTQSGLIKDDRYVTTIRTAKYWADGRREGVYVDVLTDDTEDIPLEFAELLAVTT